MVSLPNILTKIVHAPGPIKQLSSSRTLARMVAVAIVLAASGCRMMHTAAELPDKTMSAVSPLKGKKSTVDPVEVQQNLLRFADQFSTRMLIAVEQLRRGTNSMDRAEILRWKISLGTQISSIASGPNPVANLLDMTFLVTVTRMALEQHWQPVVFGESIRPVVEACRSAETDIWRLAATVLSPEQQTELRSTIQNWYKQNPLPESVLAVRAVGFTSQLERDTKAAGSDSLFNLIKLDPLSGLDPATREIAQTRLFAERALYIAHRTPLLLRLQAELTATETADIPAVQQVLANSAQIASSAERFARLSERLPTQVSREREEILRALESQEKDLRLLANEVQQTLLAGSQMSTSLNSTLTAFDAIMKRFGVGETNSATEPKTNAEPFRIQDYTQSAAQFEVTARQLKDLLVAFDETIGSTNLSRFSTTIGQLVQETQSGGKQLVNYVFWKAVLFLSIVMAAALLYRQLIAWLTPAKTSKPAPLP